MRQTKLKLKTSLERDLISFFKYYVDIPVDEEKLMLEGLREVLDKHKLIKKPKNRPLNKYTLLSKYISAKYYNYANECKKKFDVVGKCDEYIIPPFKEILKEAWVILVGEHTLTCTDDQQNIRKCLDNITKKYNKDVSENIDLKKNTEYLISLYQEIEDNIKNIDKIKILINIPPLPSEEELSKFKYVKKNKSHSLKNMIIHSTDYHEEEIDIDQGVSELKKTTKESDEVSLSSDSSDEEKVKPIKRKVKKPPVKKHDDDSDVDETDDDKKKVKKPVKKTPVKKHQSSKKSKSKDQEKLQSKGISSGDDDTDDVDDNIIRKK